MGLDNYEWLDDSPQLATGREETHEQYQEKARKAQIQLKKIQKDEKSAQNDNQKLFLILSRFIQDSYFESLIGEVSALLSAGVSSRVIIAFIALFYPDATFYVADSLDKKKKWNFYFLFRVMKRKLSFMSRIFFQKFVLGFRNGSWWQSYFWPTNPRQFLWIKKLLKWCEVNIQRLLNAFYQIF